MGRKKKNYRSPEGLIQIPGSPFWWIKITYGGKTTKKSTEIPIENLTKATILLREVEKRLLEKQESEKEKAKEILGESITFKKRNVSSEMRHFHQEFSVSPYHFS